METVENQKVIIIQKSEADKNHPYSIISLEASDYAAIHLSGNEFKLWYYLAKNQDKHKFALSRIAFCNWSGMSKNTYTKSVNTLIELGFLVSAAENSNVYIFYELPDLTLKTPEDIQVTVPESKNLQIQKFKF